MQERTVIVDGFSKTYAMRGWRLGYGIMPEPLAGRSSSCTHAYGCTAEFTQWAASKRSAGRRTGWRRWWPNPQAARPAGGGPERHPGHLLSRAARRVLRLPQRHRAGTARRRFGAADLRQAGVALLPGTAFGDNGEGYLRLSYATSMENLEEALGRVEALVHTL